MTCTECLFAHTDPDDDEDVYSCPFDLRFCYHSGEKCHYPQDYSKLVILLRNKLDLYHKTVKARLDN